MHSAHSCEGVRCGSSENHFLFVYTSGRIPSWGRKGKLSNKFHVSKRIVNKPVGGGGEQSPMHKQILDFEILIF